MGKHTAIYVRVSTGQQNVASQLPDLKHWAAGQAEQIVWYQDKASGRNMDRPGWSRLQAAIEAGKVSKVVVWRLDRLGRTAKGLTALFDDLYNRKVGLFSLKDSLDLSTPAGRLMANVLASVAAYETEIRAERVLAGQAAARSKGKTWGGSEKGRRIKVTPEQIEVIRRMHAENAKVTAMASGTGLSRPTIYSVISSL